MRVRSLIIFNLEEIILRSNGKVLEFVTLYNIDNKKDINNLFTYYCLSEILEIYKNNKNGLIVFFIDFKKYDELIEHKGDINYKKFLKTIKNINFPLISSNAITYTAFCELMYSDCPQYDEIIADYISLPSIYNNMVKIIKKLKFYKLEENYINDIKNKIKLISTYEA